MLPVHDTEGPTTLYDRLTSAALDTEQMHEHITHQQSHHDLLSTSSSIWVKTFQKVTDHSADAASSADITFSDQTGENVLKLSNESENTDYHPFHNSTDYSLTLWLHNNHTMKGSVNSFFMKSWLELMYKLTSFKNTDKWLKLLEQISYGISKASTEQKWISQIFKIESTYDEGMNHQYIIQYQSIIDTLHFLLSYKPFSDSMIYALVQHYNSENWWTYSEMHIENWWWQMQKKLLNDAILISLLIFTDKTALTQHQSDLSAWSIYLMIENLNWKIRWAQSQLSLVLFNFLPVVENDGDNIKLSV